MPIKGQFTNWKCQSKPQDPHRTYIGVRLGLNRIRIRWFTPTIDIAFLSCGTQNCDKTWITFPPIPWVNELGWFAFIVANARFLKNHRVWRTVLLDFHRGEQIREKVGCPQQEMQFPASTVLFYGKPTVAAVKIWRCNRRCARSRRRRTKTNVTRHQT